MARLLILLFMLMAQGASALTAEERLVNPADEERARVIFRQIRCMVCAGESVNDSKADLAREMRMLIRNEIKSGKNNQQIINSLTESYGRAILMRPPFEAATYFLWLAPGLLFLLGAIWLLLWRKSAAAGMK